MEDGKRTIVVGVPPKDKRENTEKAEHGEETIVETKLRYAQKSCFHNVIFVLFGTIKVLITTL